MTMTTVRTFTVVMFAALAMAAPAFAGPVIIDGTDANDHGTVSGGVNVNGWEYMQRALENVGGQLSGPAAVSKRIAVLGINPGVSSQARNAINSAFGLSTLAGAGWGLDFYDSAASISTYFSGIGLANTSILYLPTYGNSSGDMDFAEMASVNANATQIQGFVAAGGGLFAMGESGSGAWGWLTTLIPGIVATDVGAGGIGTDITLTPAGATAFPGLTNGDLAGADPWHGYFSGNLGTLSVMGTALDGGNTRNVIIGGGTQTVISAPFPASLLLLGFGAGVVLCLRRRSEA